MSIMITLYITLFCMFEWNLSIYLEAGLFSYFTARPLFFTGQLTSGGGGKQLRLVAHSRDSHKSLSGQYTKLNMKGKRGVLSRNNYSGILFALT